MRAPLSQALAIPSVRLPDLPRGWSSQSCPFGLHQFPQSQISTQMAQRSQRRNVERCPIVPGGGNIFYFLTLCLGVSVAKLSSSFNRQRVYRRGNSAGHRQDRKSVV